MRVFECGRRTRELSAVALSAGGLLAAGGEYNGTLVWDATGGTKPRWLDDLGHRVSGLHFHPDSGLLLIATLYHGLYVWNPALDGPHLIPVHRETAGEAAVAPDGRVLVSGGNRLTALDRVGGPDAAVAWSVPLNDEIGGNGWTRGLGSLPDGERFVSAEVLLGPGYVHRDNRVAVRSWADGRVLAALGGLFRYGHHLHASAAADVFVIRKEVWLRVYSADDLKADPRVIRNDNRKHFTGAAFHPSGRYLAATSNDATVKLYDTASWEVARTFTWDIGRMRSICFSPDGTLAAAGSDTGKVVVWDVDV